MPLELSKYQSVFNIIKYSMFDIPFDFDTVQSWEEPIRILQDHALSGIFPDVCMLSNIDDNLKKTLQSKGYSTIRHQIIVLREQEKLFQLLDEMGVEAVVIKGAIDAIYYNYPNKRSMGDIDLLISPDNWEKTITLLSQNGYQIMNNLDDVHQVERHVEFCKNDVEVELHRRLSRIRGAKEPEMLESYFRLGLSERKKYSLCNNTFYGMPDLENGLSILYHIYLHFYSGIGLRQIIDWMFFVDKFLTDEVWNNCFEKILIEAKLDIFATTITRMCQKYLGLSSKIEWCHAANDETCDVTLDFIMRNGNFGSSAKFVLSGEQVKISKNPFKLLKHLQSSGMDSLIKKYGAKKANFLKPFAWVIQLFRYLYKLSSKKISVKNLKTAYTLGQENIQLFNNLGLPYGK